MARYNRHTNRGAAASPANQGGTTAAHQGTIPILKVVLGLVLIGFFLLALMLQIQTSEAFLLGSSPVQLAANWGVLSQPLALLGGQLPLDAAKAVMWGWGIELVYLVAFNCWTDFNYGHLASGFWGQVAFAGITSFIVAFFGVLGLNLLWGALTDFSR